MPTTLYEIHNARSGALEVGPIKDRELATAELDRLNREAETGERAAYDDGEGGEVPAQRLVALNSGHTLASSPDDPLRAEDVGRLLHRGMPTGFELVIRQVPTEDEQREADERAAAAAQADAEKAQQDADRAMIDRLRAAGFQITRR